MNHKNVRFEFMGFEPDHSCRTAYVSDSSMKIVQEAI